jgi:hypothetical protein
MPMLETGVEKMGLIGSRLRGVILKAVILSVGFLTLAGGTCWATPLVAAGVGSRQETAIKKAMQGIYSDLKKVKLKFFQLRYIDNAKLYNNEFRYTTGLQHDSKLDGPTFSKYGCDIYVHIKYPATGQDMELRHSEGVLVSLKDGSSYALWKIIRTEPTEEGHAFAEKVNEIVTARLDALKRELEQD